MTDEVIRLILDMGNSGGNVEEVRKKLDTLAASTEKAAHSQREMQMRVLEAGRAFQDFMQGGIGGVLNNIERLVGGPGMAAGLITIAAVALNALWPKIKEFLGATQEADGVTKKWAESLGKAREQVAELNKEALPRVAALARERDALQAVIDRHNEQIAAIQKLRKLQGMDEADAEKHRAQGLQEIVGGRQAELVGQVAAGMVSPDVRAGRGRARTQLQAEIAGMERNLAATPASDIAGRAQLGREIAARRRRLQSLDETEAGERARAEEMVAGAVIQGRAPALRDVLARMPEGPLRDQMGDFLEGGSTRQEKMRQQADHARRVLAEQDKARQLGQSDERARRQRMREAHEIGERFGRPEASKLRAIPLMPEDGSPVELMQVMAQSQEAMAQNQRHDAEELRRIKQSLHRTSRVLWDRKQTSANAGTAE
jgi:hypothetical protein